jgi:tRNA G37 N-methylase Trm5
MKVSRLLLPWGRDFMLYESNSLILAHRFIESYVKCGDHVIDATAGRGKDTLFLCRLVGEEGHVYTFDIQKEAIESTRELLTQNHMEKRATLILDSHANMDRYISPGQVSAVVFNFGYLPGGDHRVYTRAPSSIEAIGKALLLVKSFGIVSLCIYYGGDSGFEERDGLMEYLKTIDPIHYTVLLEEFINRPNCPPHVVHIQRND